MSDGLTAHRPTLGKIACKCPELQRRLIQPSRCVMLREQSGLRRRNRWEFVFEGRSDLAMQFLPLTSQPGAIGCVLDQCMLEQIRRMGRHTLPKQQACLIRRSSADWSSASGFCATAAKRVV